MNQKLFPLVLLFGISSTCFAQNRYVDATAPNGGNGTSWLSAYNDLQIALADPIGPDTDTIFVAEGTYTPDIANGNLDATFFISNDVVLIGGFQTGGLQHNPELYPTILSGDLNGNDIAGNFNNFKSDNVRTVVTIDESITNATVIDGFVIRGGHANDPNGPENVYFRGGGLYSMGSQIIRNCVFEENYAYYFGGGAQLQRNDGIITVTVENCIFRSNRSARGAGLNIHNVNCIVSNCEFVDNIAPEYGGGMRYYGNRTNRTVEIQDCLFSNNSSAFGGGLVLSIVQDGNSLIMDGCEFTNNRTELYQNWGQGGAGAQILIFDEADEVNYNSVTIKNCTYTGNTTGMISGTAGSGGGLSLGTLHANNTSILIDSCSFQNNESRKNGSAASLNLDGLNGNVQIENCFFNENIANVAAALDIYQDQATGNVTVHNCQFNQNSSLFTSGALEIGNQGNSGLGMAFQVSQSNFASNQAEEGGAISLWNYGHSPLDVKFEDCIIENNTASVRGGAFNVMPESDSLTLKSVRCQIKGNTSPTGGAIDAKFSNNISILPQNYFIQIENSLIAEGTNDEAAIRVDFVSQLKLLNCTIADYLGGAIELANQSNLTLQNTILSSPLVPTISDLSDDGNVSSLGGNLLTDSALSELSAAQSSDQETDNPLFVGSGEPCLYYSLTANSNAIGRGIDEANESTTDVCGNNRVVGCIDVGAYEYPDDTSMDCITNLGEIHTLHSMLISPNPVFNDLQLIFSDEIIDPVHVSISDGQGKLLKNQMTQVGQPIKVIDLLPGLYFLRTDVGDVSYVSKFVKI